MKLHAVLGIGLLLAGTGVAFAEDNSSIPEPNVQPRGTYVPIDPTQADVIPMEQVIAGGAPCNLIYVNNCQNEPNGTCVIRPGFESSINDTSGIIGQTAYLQSVGFSASQWDAIMSCVRETYAPFDIDITDQDPGTACHWETIVAGSPQDAGMQQGVAGVSPWDPYNCSIIQNSITYTFAEVFSPSDVVNLCWTIVQETAHSFGLDHEFLAEDPMTYLTGSDLPGGFKRFQNVNAQCGEYQARPCQCTSTQNSVQMLTGIFGAATPTPPVVTIDSPKNSQQVEPGFAVRTTIEDNTGIARADLYVNDELVQSLTTGPFAFNAPATLGEGTHRVRVVAVDSQGTSGSSATVSVIIGEPCETPADCSPQGEEMTCVDGRCVPGEGAPGGLGTECEDNAQCASGRCQASDQGTYCVEDCDPTLDGCPSGFRCLDDAAICWPGDDGEGGGCLDAGNRGRVPTVPIALGIALGVLMMRRRRR